MCPSLLGTWQPAKQACCLLSCSLMSRGKDKQPNNCINLEFPKVMSALKEKFGSYENVGDAGLVWKVSETSGGRKA